jgi:hypothetical protein
MTQSQFAANRANAKLSTGPRTEEGKKRSSLNAFRHGLTGQIVIHTPEDQAAFQKHCDAIREALAPVGALEFDLAQAIAEDKWRLNRACARALQAERKAAIEQAEKEARLLVQLAEAHSPLVALCASNKAEGGNYDPANDFPPESQPLGFVFSRLEIQRQIERGQRLELAAAASRA